MAGKYLHIGFNWVGPPKIKDLEPVIGLYSVDWMRYGVSGWIIYTIYEIPNLVAGLRPYLGPNDQMIIFEVARPGEGNGWMPKWIWDWMNKTR